MTKKLLSLLILAASALLGDVYEAKNYDRLLGNVDGISDDVLTMHFRLYQGYVKNTNQLIFLLKDLEAKGNVKGQEYGSLKKVFGWEFDGMRLHEYYFENLGGKDVLSNDEPLYKAIERDFGSYDAWKKDFIATGLIRGIGWVILYYDTQQGRLINEWITEHHINHLAGAAPILVMDVWEHAYITQYGLDRASYIDAFIKNINWKEVATRYIPKEQK